MIADDKIAILHYTKALFSSVLDDSSSCDFPGYQAIAAANPYFIRENVEFALRSWADALTPEAIDAWLQPYTNRITHNDKTIALVFAGNIPLVGLHDFLCCLLAGCHITAKLSSKDQLLPKWYSDCLIREFPELADTVKFTDHIIKEFDAVIATGSNNSGRYFDYYFSKYPNIIRRNRNSIALITGNETDEELSLLADDVFIYFGMGCRSISMLLVPTAYDFNRLIHAFTEKYWHLINLHKYANNYDYYRTLFLMNRSLFLDCGFFLMRENNSIASPIAVLNYMYYNSLEEANAFLMEAADKIQCVVTAGERIGQTAFGYAQKPALNDYSDGIDTLKFLLFL